MANLRKNTAVLPSLLDFFRRGGKTLALLLAQIIFTVWIAVTVSFFAMMAVPGDPIEIRFGPLAKISSEQKDLLRIEYGLDLPAWQQYLLHLKELAAFNLGYSYNKQLPVAELLAQQLPQTLELAGASILLTVLFVLLGQILKRAFLPWQHLGRARQSLFDTVSVIAVSSPNYWLGYLLIAIFAFGLKLFPAGGADSSSALVLPAFALAIPAAAFLGQLVDSELNTAEKTTFAFNSFAKGQSRLQFAFRHGFLHALAPTLAVSVNIFGSILGGAVLTETVFARPGLGRVALEAVLNRDMPVVLALVALSSLIFSVLSVTAQRLTAKFSVARDNRYA